MHLNLFLIKKYWICHKKQALILILSYILLITFIFTSLSMLRTELRRTYVDLFSTENNINNYGDVYSGAYNFNLIGVNNDYVEDLSNRTYISQCETLYIGGKMGIDSLKYTYGSYSNSIAFEMSGILLKEGNLPLNSGEITISERVLNYLQIDSSIGDTITLSTYDFDGNYLKDATFILVGIIKDDGYHADWETEKVTEGSFLNFHEPVILISNYDMAKVENPMLCAMIRFTFGQRLISLSNKETEILSNFMENELYVNSKCVIRGSWDSSYFTYLNNISNDEYNGYIKSAKSNYYQDVSFIASVVMIITLISSLMTIIPNRLKSMKLLHQIGYSIKKLQLMFMLEWFIFTTVGLILGLSIAMLLYEVILQVQYHVFGLGLYRAYNVEWGIKMITYNPFIFAIICTLIGSLIAYIIPCIKLKKLLSPRIDNNSNLKLKRKKNNIHDIVKSILYQPLITGLQIVSLILVLVVSSSAYMFFSTENKSSKQNPQILAQGDLFNTNIGLDMRTYNIDCTLQSTNGTIAGIMQTDTTGITKEAMNNIESSPLFKNVIGFKNIYGVFLYYPNGTHITQNIQNIDDLFAPQEKQWYGIQNYDIYTFNNCMIVSDSIISQLSKYCNINIEKLNKGGIIEFDLEGGSKYQVGDILPIVTAYGKYNINNESTYYYDLQKVTFSNSEILSKISINSLTYEENPLLYSIFSSNSKYIMVYSMQGAKSIGLVNSNVSNVYLTYAKNTTDNIALEFINGTLSANMEVSKTTLTDCQSDYNKSMIKEYLIVFTVFGLFFIISMIGYIQTIRLQIYKKSYQFNILQSLGISKNKLQTSIVSQILTTPIISSIIALIGIQGLRIFLEYKYNYWEILYYQKGEYTTDNQIKYLLQQAKYFTQYEMYKVPIAKIFIILVFIILIFTCICTYKISKNVVNTNLAEDLKKQEH